MNEYNTSRRFEGSTYPRYRLPGITSIVSVKEKERKRTPD